MSGAPVPATPRERVLRAVVLVLLVLVVALVFRGPLGAWFTGTPAEEERAGAAMHAGPLGPGAARDAGGAATAEEIDHYTCSMHPYVNQKTPGKCPVCGMDLIPVTKAQQEQGVVLIDEGRRQLIGVRTAPVREAPMQRTIRAVGQVTYDETALSDVSLKVRGWITKLYVNQTSQRVARGQTLFTLYSPDIYNAEQDFLLARSRSPISDPTDAGASGDVLARASRLRLGLLGVGEAQIDAIARSGTPLESVPFASPASGFVVEKNVVEGAAVDAGMRLYRIAALDRVWIEADLYEGDLALARVGQRADVTLDYLPGRAYEAHVAYVYPSVDPKARTGRIRVELANKGLDLRPGMYATVQLAADLGPRVQVPVGAVVYTGPRRLVFVDLGDGRFRPQQIDVGTESNGEVEVRGGVRPGDVVATSGVFLIAAEARIRTAAKYWDPSGDAMDAGLDAPATPFPSSPGSDTPRASSPPGSTPPPQRPPPPMPSHAAAPSPSALAPTPAPTVYTCPMHPEVASPTPGRCPRCGMELVPKGGDR